jgi:hypothetical protein
MKFYLKEISPTKDFTGRIFHRQDILDFRGITEDKIHRQEN